MTGDGLRCDPFTITDAHSRYLIRCQTVSRMDLSQVRAICEAAMREYGLPARIRTDNGAPFAGTGLLGLSKLSLGWMKMGIVHERIQPGRPQQNGRHERMHRSLKEDTANPPAANLRLQQRKFDRFRHVFNHERPHEGLNNETLAVCINPARLCFHGPRLNMSTRRASSPDGSIIVETSVGTRIGSLSARSFALKSLASRRYRKTFTGSSSVMLRSESSTLKLCVSGLCMCLDDELA